MTRMRLLCIVLVVVIAVLLDLPLLQHDLTIDEIWSLRLASTLPNPLGIFQLHSDNNHYLNTLFLWFLGPKQPFWIYRIPSFIAGIALVAAVTIGGWRKNTLTGFVLGLMTALSPAITLFSTQARGYLPMLFFGCLSAVVMERLIKKKNKGDAAVFAGLAIVSFLWQLMYIHLYIGLLVWSLLSLQKRQKDRWLLIIAHLPVVLLLALLALTDFSTLVIGGGPLSTPTQFALGSIALMSGTPTSGLLPVLVGLGMVIFLVWHAEALVTHPKQRAKGLAAITLFLGSPILWMLFFHPTILYPRYILVCLFFALILVGKAIAEGMRSKQLMIRVCSSALLILYMGSTLSARNTFLKHPHDYSNAVMTMLHQTLKNPITIGSNVDFRTSLLLWFYAPRVAQYRTITYLTAEQRKIQKPDFWIIDTQIEQISQSPVHPKETPYWLIQKQ